MVKSGKKHKKGSGMAARAPRSSSPAASPLASSRRLKAHVSPQPPTDHTTAPTPKRQVKVAKTVAKTTGNATGKTTGKTTAKSTQKTTEKALKKAVGKAAAKTPATTSARSAERAAASPAARTGTSRFLNRELQLLAFNRRVLAQAENPAVPLLERLRFVSIVSSNLDEFFEIRVAGLKEQVRAGSVARTPDGRTPKDAYRQVVAAAHELVANQYALLNDELLPALAAEGIRFVRRAQWSAAQRAWIKDFFFREMMPVLTPIGLDPSHPFPRVFNKSLNFAVELSGRDAFGRDSKRAIVQAPRLLPRVIKLPRATTDGENDFIFLSSILHAHVGELFAGMDVLGCYQFRVTRNSDLFVDEEEVKNLRQALQGELPQRHLGDTVRLEVADNCSEDMVQFLLTQFELAESDLYQVNGPVNLVRLMNVADQVARPDLKFRPFVPGLPKLLTKAPKIEKLAKTVGSTQTTGVAHARDIFRQLRKNDILLHHPFESFNPVIEFIQAAARDPAVVAIKQTVYRTGTDSVIMEALIEAATRGKEVTVVVELMARFDEEANLNWAARLEDVGAHVVYGVVGHKTHAKMALIVRREPVDDDSGRHVLRRYVHLGTGNYHPRTARLYTDFGLMTSNEAITTDVNEVFTQLTGLGRATKLSQVWQSPFTLHKGVLAAIENEISIASAKSSKSKTRSGKSGGRIIAKMNSLVEPAVIDALYRASQAGVKIDLIVRGVCALRPGVAGLSENIRVRSIVGRFLEHTRVLYFGNGGSPVVMLSSADWMERNFFRRIELCFPVNDKKLKKRVIDEGLTPYLADNVGAWEMDGDGAYVQKTPRNPSQRVSAQEILLASLAES
jgi:polyphosphate kinase